MVGERRFLAQKILKGGSFLSVAVCLPLIGNHVVVFEIVLPIKLLDTLSFSFDLREVIIARRGRFLRSLGDGLVLKLFCLIHFFQEWVFLQFLAEHVDQLQPGELKKPNRLLKLRRNDELLAQFDCLF